MVYDNGSGLAGYEFQGRLLGLWLCILLGNPVSIYMIQVYVASQRSVHHLVRNVTVFRRISQSKLPQPRTQIL